MRETENNQIVHEQGQTLFEQMCNRSFKTIKGKSFDQNNF